jgi:hypothetical protein
MATYSSIKSFKKEYNEQLPVEGVPVGSVSYIDGEFYIWDGIEWGKINTVAPDVNFGAVYTIPGTYSWTAPEGVTSVSVVAVGGGGGGLSRTNDTGHGGGGGGLGWKNNITVVPGQTYTVVVGSGGLRLSTFVPGESAENGGDSYFISLNTVSGLGGAGGEYDTSTPQAGFTGDGGGWGGVVSAHSGPDGATHRATGGGGAGGYGVNSNGGGSTIDSAGTAGTGGGGGGGGAGGLNDAAGGGGGVGLYGLGADGAGGAYSDGNGGPGGGGSGGESGSADPGNIARPANGGLYGGGGGGSENSNENGDGAGGAVRIIWGLNRLFPSTNTEDSATLPNGSNENVI